MSDQRPPDELDALLAKTETDQQEGRSDADAAPHRKSYSIDMGASSTGGAPRRGRGKHRKHMSSISELFITGVRHLDPIREDFQETAKGLKTNFVRGLDKMDRGEVGFFDMSMTRSLSVLPDDLSHLIDEAGVKEQVGPPVMQYVALLTAVAAISSNSTALHMLDGVEPTMKLFWRMTASYVALSPLAFQYFYKDGFPKLSLGGWLTFIAAVVCYATQNCLFYSALEYTTIGNAVIYSNSQALLLVIGKAFVGERIHPLEGCGVIIAFTGAILCSRDSESSSREGDTSSAIHGDLLALASAVLGVAYLTFAKAVRPEMSVTVLIFCVMFFGSLLVLLLIALNGESALEFNANPYHGVFGWFDISHYRLPILLYLAVVVNMVGTMGFVRGTLPALGLFLECL
jgi:drug/metabolite transporter (DMT)-like permease